MPDALQLLAEALSALRVAVAQLGESQDDVQNEAFLWLRSQTEERRIYVSRHMRLNDPADPAAWGELRARIQEQEDALRVEVERERQRRKAWGRLRYHLDQTARDEAADTAAHWTRALEAIDALVDSGVPPSSVELRDLLLPHLDSLPDDLELPRGALLALREIDRYQASREAEEDSASGGLAGRATAEPTEEVRRLRSLLAGRAMVLIGGVHRPRQVGLIEEAFDLSELVWLDGGSPSYTQFEPAIARPDVAVVVLMIRWSSHGYGEVRSLCEQYDRPFVRLPSGYNPNQLAFQILDQVGERLAGERAATP
jgi:hypothetical protein